MVYYTVIKTDFGWVAVAGGEAGVCALTLPQATFEMALAQLSLSLPDLSPADNAFGDLPQRLRRYFAGEPVAFPDKLDLSRGTRFQRAAWQAVRSIPYGETRSYAWVASQACRAERPERAARAAGRAMATNPVPIIVPCHRVVGSDGSLTGFGGGLDMKRRLLEMEASNCPGQGAQR